MDFNTTIDIIIKDLREIREIVDDLKNYPGVPHLQIELAKSKCRSAEEIISLLKTYRPDTKMEPAAETVVRKPLGTKTENLIELSDDDSTDESAIRANEPAGEHKPDYSIIREVMGETAILADKFTGTTNTLFEQFGSMKKEDDISSVMNTKPVSDLSDAIGINDKFLFIREIFGGNKGAYEEALLKLNKAENLPDARAIVMSYTGDGDETEVVTQLLEIVKRKLPSDG